MNNAEQISREKAENLELQIQIYAKVTGVSLQKARKIWMKGRKNHDK